MNNPRHLFAVQAITVPAAQESALADAFNYERSGNWVLAAEAYITLHDEVLGKDTLVHAQILTHAASCLELAGVSRSAARNYERAAQIISGLTFNLQLAGELYNRAALQYHQSQEYFFAGSAWTRAAEEFEKVPADIINCSENLRPLPVSAFKSHLCGSCFEAAADSYKLVLGEEVWAVGAYWRAGNAYAKGVPNIQAFSAYRRALQSGIQYYKTLELENLRRYLPLASEEREARLNPIEVMETVLSRLGIHQLKFQTSPGAAEEINLDIQRQMAATFHMFSLEFLSVGNSSEAGKFRIAENDRKRKIAILEHRYMSATFYFLWRQTSCYGESLSRWAITCFGVIVAFAFFYWILGVIVPTMGTATGLNFFDAIYFSVATFTTLGYGDIRPVGLVGEALASLEVIAGFTMFGILLSFAGSRFLRG